MSESVALENKGPVAWIRLNAPHGNALTPTLVAEIDAVLDEAEVAPETSAVVITSETRNFCTGAELSLLARVARDPLTDRNFDDLGSIYQLFCRLQDYPLPTLAGVGGKVLGAGINLALACDVRIVADDVLVRGFGASGVHPGGGHLRMLNRALGAQSAAELALFGATYDAEQAVATGFALRSVARSDLESSALEMALRAGSDAALARRVTASFRATRGDVVTPGGAVALERANQIWSLGRRNYA